MNIADTKPWLMRTLQGLAVIFIVSQPVFADQIPSAVQKSLAPFQPVESSLIDGVLRLRLKAPVVRTEVFRNTTLAVYRPLTMSVSGDKSGWGKATIDRIEVINQIGAQGFAFVGGKKSCGQLEQFSSAESNAGTFAKNTWVCVAGNPCRARQDGEVTSGDE